MCPNLVWNYTVYKSKIEFQPFPGVRGGLVDSEVKIQVAQMINSHILNPGVGVRF